MKSKVFLFVLLGTVLFNYRCSTSKMMDKTNPDTLAFVGNWVGENYENNAMSTWVQKRFSDGTYLTLFVTVKGNEAARKVESGKWWLENGKFYEISPEVMEKPDVYDYTIVTNNHIIFKSTTTDYQFTDRRVEENHSDKIRIK